MIGIRYGLVCGEVTLLTVVLPGCAACVDSVVRGCWTTEGAHEAAQGSTVVPVSLQKLF